MPKPVDEQTMKERRGQFFTTSADVQEAMASLLTHVPSSSRCLEPSAGAGDLVSTLERHGYADIDAIEFDPSIETICGTEIERGSFFRYACGKEGRYDIIFGNPPYVAWKNLEDSQKTDPDVLEIKDRGYSDKCNFYLLFIDRCIDLLSNGGEIVLIVPKEWLYSTSAAPLREKMKRDGSLTHIIDIGEERVFDDAMPPATIIFRYVRGEHGDTVLVASGIDAAENGGWAEKTIVDFGDRWGLLDGDTAAGIGSDWIRLGDLYVPRVGIVSGADPIFRCGDDAPDGIGIVPYVTTRGVEMFIDPTGYDFDELCGYARHRLISNEKKLRSRKIMKITDSNWFRYGAVRNRDAMLSDTERFYVKNRTRESEPFFDDAASRELGAVLYSGGILGLFRTPSAPEDMRKSDIIGYLNSTLAAQLFEAMGITTGTKRTFLPSLVEEIPVPYSVAHHDSE